MSVGGKVNHVCEVLLPRDGWAAAGVHTCWPHYKPSPTQPRKLLFFPVSFQQRTHSSRLKLQCTLVAVPAAQPCLPAWRLTDTEGCEGLGTTKTLSPGEAEPLFSWRLLDSESKEKDLSSCYHPMRFQPRLGQSYLKGLRKGWGVPLEIKIKQ